MANCPLPGETLPSIIIDGVTIHPIPPHIAPGEDPGNQGVEVHVNLTARQVIEDEEESNWLQDETLLKYLSLRVIQVRRPEAERFLVGAIGDLIRRNLIGKPLTPSQIGDQILTVNETFYQPGGFLEYAGFPYTHTDRNLSRGINTIEAVNSMEQSSKIILMFSKPNDFLINRSFKNYFSNVLEARRAGANRLQDPPPYTDVIAPGGFNGGNGNIDYRNRLIGSLIYNCLGVPDPSLPNPYTVLGVQNRRLNFEQGRLRMPAEGIVTIYDRPLRIDEGPDAFFAPTITREGEALIIETQLNTVKFGNPLQAGNHGDRTLTSKDIEYLRYHAFLYVDLNKLMEDMDLDDD